MPARRVSSVAAWLPRVPVASLGVVIAASALQASCSGTMDDDIGGGDAGRRGADAALLDGPPSEDSPSDRADGMSYGDGYGSRDAHVADAENEDSSCVTSLATYPPAAGCPAGNHVWACWPPTSATGGIPDSHYTVLTLCGEVVVVDKNTHLMWDQQEKPGQYTWVEAAAACTGSRRAGFSDWRLPSSNELMTLVDYTRKTTPVADSDVFDFQSPANHSSWSSTVSAQQAGYAWQQFGVGGVYAQSVATPGYVRCVR